MKRIHRPGRLLSMIVMATVTLAVGACDEQELNDLDRGTDERPAVEPTPPEEGQ